MGVLLYFDTPFNMFLTGERFIMLTAIKETTQLNVGGGSFNLAGLSNEAKKTIAFLANQPDLIDQLNVDRERVWKECEVLFGKLSEVDLRTLNTLYDLFIAPGACNIVYGGTVSQMPFNCWVGNDCPSNR
jgi:hypothetical protein